LLKVACSGLGVSRTRNLLVTFPILYQLDHCTHIIAARWQEYFSTLPNWPTQSAPDALDRYSILQGVCAIYPDYIQHGGSDALGTLHKIVTRVWEKEWHQGIIIPTV